MADGDQLAPPTLAQVPDIPIDRGVTESVLGMGVRPGSSLDQALQLHHAQRAAQAQIYRTALSSALGQKYKGTKWDPTLNNGAGGERPFTDEERSILDAQIEHATNQYNKMIGVNPQAKSALEKAHGIISAIFGHKDQQQQNQRPGSMPPPPAPYYPTTVSDAGISATPPPPGSTANITDAGLSFTPPPTPQRQPSMLEQAAVAPLVAHEQMVGQNLEDRQRALRSGVQTRQGLVKQFIPQEDWNKPYVQDYVLTGNMTRGMLAHLQKSNMVDPDTGEPVIFDPMSGEYATQDGRQVKNPVPYQKPAMAEIEDAKSPGGHFTGFEQYGKLYDQNWNQLPAGTKKFFVQTLPRQTQQNTFEKVQQPDGSTALVPVTKTSTTTRGPVPPGKPGGAPPAASVPGETTVAKPNFGPQAKKASSPQANAAAAYGLPPGSRIVGGKVPPGVAKAYENYNGSVTRFKVMQDALPQALKGNQQAMINLLYNHIGMTTGLQKGGRITQPIIDEAQNSAPWMATLLKRIGVDNEFEIDPTMLRGVVLDSATMHNMIELAQDRVNQEYQAWQREIAAAKGGYGMQTGGLQPPPAPTGSTGGTVHFTSPDNPQGWDIPVEKVDKFMKAHPNAKR